MLCSANELCEVERCEGADNLSPEAGDEAGTVELISLPDGGRPGL